VQTIVCPPFIYIAKLVDSHKGHRIAFGSQNVFSENKGAFTGMISPNMLKNKGVEYVIIGHSERRALCEDNILVNKKIKSAIKSGLKVILCIGEKERDDHGHYFNFLKKQLLDSLEGVPKNSLHNLFIAYEPIWALSGNSGNKSMSSADVHEITIFIKKILHDQYRVKVMPKILYGGSANPKNAEDLILNGNVDGLLVGKASLDAKKFGEILSIVNKL